MSALSRADRRLTLDRRSFIGGLLVAGSGLALGACGGGGSSRELSASRLFDSRTLVPDGTPQRMVWAISDVDGYLTSTAPDSITVTAVQNDTTILDGMTVEARRDGLLVPYYPISMPFADASPVEFTFDADGSEFTSFVDARGTSDSSLVGPGDAMPAVATPTFDTPLDADPVCTRSPEPCPFHETSLDEALAAGRPTIVNISTPAFCSNQIACGPALEVLIEAAPSIPDDVAIIHAEVYRAPTSRELGPVAPIMDATGLWFEPALYVIDVSGVVTERLDFMWDAIDLASAVGI